VPDVRAPVSRFRSACGGSRRTPRMAAPALIIFHRGQADAGRPHGSISIDGGFRVAQQATAFPSCPSVSCDPFSITGRATGCSGRREYTVLLHDTIENQRTHKRRRADTARTRPQKLLRLPVEEALKQDCHGETGAIEWRREVATIVSRPRGFPGTGDPDRNLVNHNTNSPCFLYV